MDRNKIAVSVPNDRPRVAQPVAALLTGALLIGLSLSEVMPERVSADTRVMPRNERSSVSTMNGKKSSPIQRSVQTASGRISYTEQGTGPVALFVHGVLLNGHLWRHQLADLSDIRRMYP